MSRKTRGKTKSRASASDSPQNRPRTQAVALKTIGGENRITRLEGAPGASALDHGIPDAPEETEAILAAAVGTDDVDLAKDLERLSKASSTLTHAHSLVDQRRAAGRPASEVPRNAKRPGHGGSDVFSPGADPAPDDRVQSSDAQEAPGAVLLKPGEEQRPGGTAVVCDRSATGGECSDPTVGGRDEETMKEHLTTHLDEPDPQAVGGVPTPDRRRADIEAELRRSREELRRLREKAADQTQMYGALGAQGRRLDQRAVELREKVAHAQRALDERASRLRSELQQDRDRLKAYRDKLQEKARELADSTRDQKKKLAEQRDDLARRLEMLEQRKAEDAEAERRNQQQLALLAEQAQSPEEIRAEIQESVQKERERLKEELEQVHRKREVELEARLAVLEERLATRQSEMSTELSSELDAQRATIMEEARSVKDELDEEVRRRRAEIERIESLAADREAAVRIQEEDLAARETAQTREDSEFRNHEEELAQVSGVLETREKRLTAWQSQIEDAEAALDTERQRIENQRKEADLQIDEEHAKLKAELHARETALREAETRLTSREEAVATRDEALSATEHGLEEREARQSRSDEELTCLSHTLDEREKQLREHQSRIKTVEARLKAEREALERNVDEAEGDRPSGLEERETALLARDEDLQEAEARFEQARQDLDGERTAVQVQTMALDQKEEELAVRERRIDERIVKAAEIEHRVRQVESEQDAERGKLSEMRTAGERDASALAEARAAHSSEQEELTAARIEYQLDRDKLDDQIQGIAEKEAALAEAKSQLESEREHLTSSKESSAAHESEISLGQDRLSTQKRELEEELAKVERDRVALQDRERLLAEGRAKLQADRASAEEMEARAARRFNEATQLRGKLVAKVARYQQRKARFAEDSAELAGRGERLEADLDEVRRQRDELKREREQFEEDRAKLPTEREAQARDRETLGHAQRTFEAGLRKLETDQRELAEREAKLAERTDQLASQRGRLESEREDLQSQREELLAIEQSRGESAERVTALMEQAELQASQLKERENAIQVYEEALAARAAELARAEDGLDRRNAEIESSAGLLETDREALQRERDEIESVRAAEMAAVEEQRRENDAELAAERDRLREREQELETLITQRREALEAEHLDREQADLGEVRKQVEAEMADRLASVAREEEQVEQRCKARLEEVERDIQSRLGVFEDEIRQSREQAEHEFADRSKQLEDEMGGVRNRLEEQIEDLRQRQTLVTQEQDLLQRRRTELEGAGSLETPQIKSLEHPELDLPDPRSATDLVLVGEGGATVDLADDSAVEFMDDTEDEALDVLPDGDWSPIGESPATQTPSPSLEGAQADPSADRPRDRRFRPVPASLGALLVGALATAGFMWSPGHDATIRGRWALNNQAQGASMTPREHLAAIVGTPQVFEVASQRAGVDIEQMFNDRRVEVIPSKSGLAVEVMARAPSADRQEVQGWVDALGQAYVETLEHSVISQAQRKRLLAEAESSYAAKKAELTQARARLEKMQAAAGGDETVNDLSVARDEQERLKKQASDALASLESARAELARFEAIPLARGPIVPNEALITAEMQKDTKAVQTVQERAGKAADFHVVLTQALMGSPSSLSILRTEIKGFIGEVDRQLRQQTDSEIRRELELVAVDLAEFLQQTAGFAEDWSRLLPKVAAWQPGADPELLLEYQKRAEVLVRGFHKASRVALGKAIKKADQIGRGGTEMTKRRIIQNALASLSHACFEARNEWIVTASEVVPANNLELKALRDALTKLTPRIEERREFHRAQVAQRLAKQRQTDRAATLSSLRARVGEADAHHRELNRRAMESMESMVSLDQTAIQTLEQRRAAVSAQHQKVEKLRRELEESSTAVARLKKDERISMAGAVNYEPLEPILAGEFDLSRLNRALGSGGVVALLVLLVAWASTRRRGRSDSATQR